MNKRVFIFFGLASMAAATLTAQSWHSIDAYGKGGRGFHRSAPGNRGYGAAPAFFADEAAAQAAAQSFIDQYLEGYSITLMESSVRGVTPAGAEAKQYRAKARDASGNEFYIHPFPNGAGGRVLPVKFSELNPWSGENPFMTGIAVTSADTAQAAVKTFVEENFSGYTTGAATALNGQYPAYQVEAIDASGNIFYLFVDNNGFIRGFVPGSMSEFAGAPRGDWGRAGRRR